MEQSRIQGRMADLVTHYDDPSRKPMVIQTDGKEGSTTFWSFQRSMIKATFASLPTMLIFIAAVIAILLIEFGPK